MADLYELAGNYVYKSDQYCSETRKVGTCYYYLPIIGEFTSPMWEYYVPFQRVEATNVPFLTGYWPQEDVRAGENLFKGSGVFPVTYQSLDTETMSDRVQDGKDTYKFPGMKTMKLESDQALYDGFMPKAMEGIIQGIMGASDSKMEWKERLPPNWEEVVTKYLDEYIPNNTATNYNPDGTIGNPSGNPGDGKVDEELLKHLKKSFDRDISRWRDSGDSVDGHSRMEYHFSTTLFHDVMKNFPEFNKFGAVFGFPPVANWRGYINEEITWCHKGANWAFFGQIFKKREQLFFGEWVYHGLFARTYSMLSWLWEGLKEYTPPKLDPLNCALKNLVSKGGDTPDDMNLTPENFGDTIEKYCMASNHNDTIGPVTNVHKTHYPALASEQAFRRGLLAAREFPKKDPATHNVRDRDEGFLYRDKFMIFNTEYNTEDPEVGWVKKMFNGIEPKSNHNKEFPRGCQNWDRSSTQKEFTADWGGAGYGTANHLNLDYDGHRHVRAHFRFIRCCPWFPYDWVPKHLPFQLE